MQSSVIRAITAGTSCRLKASLNWLITSIVAAVCATSCMISCSLLKAIAKGSDLSAVLAFVSVVHVDKHVIQGIVHAIPGQGSGVAEHLRANPLSQQHHLRVCISELVQHLAHCSPPASGHLGIVKLATQLGKLVQGGCRVPTDKPGQDIDQDLFIGSEVSDNVLN